MSDLNEKSQKILKEMFDDIDGVNVDDIKTTGITIRAGNKLVKLQVLHEEPITIEDEIREEFRQRLVVKLQEIKNRLNTKVNEIDNMAARVRIEAERKENELKEKLRLATPMPLITIDHAKKGISLVKGSNKDELVWLVRGVYAPKFVDRHPIDPNYAKKLITNIVFYIRTSVDRVVECSTRKVYGLDYFPHYHQARPDCWGNWSYPRSWNKVEDLIKIAKDAEAVLENINTGSVANHSPRGLPRDSTLERHVLNNHLGPAPSHGEPSTEDIREGIVERNSDEIWSA